MILHKITMNNFRQFCGTQSLEFASNPEDKNVTVIFGDNGRGKTGIFRALMFCLYGDLKLSQDGDVDKKEIYLANTKELEEAKGEPIETSVEVEFSHKGEHYSLKRSILAMLEHNNVIQESKDVYLRRQKTDGNTITTYDPREIAQLINSILDRRVKDYFLFDGEKMERLTLASVEQRREVAKGIRNLLNVDALETAVKACERLKRALDSELSKKATGEFGRLLKQLTDCEDQQKLLSQQLVDIETELTHAQEERRNLDKELEKFGEIRGLLEMRAEIESQLKEREDQAAALLIDMKGRISKGSMLLAKTTIESVFDVIDQQKQKGEIPSEIRKDLIEKILLDEKCICGSDVRVGSPSFEEIIKWKNKTTDVVFQDSALELWRFLSGIKSHIGDVAEAIETILQKYAINKNDIEKARQKLGSINKDIGSPERKDAAKLEQQREYVDSGCIKKEAERLNIQAELSILDQEYKKLQAQRQVMEREEGIKNELSLRAALANQSLEALRSVYDEFTQEIKQEIGQLATDFFMLLLDSQDRETLRRVVVNDDYSLQILDRWDKSFLANISAGQRQIMSISFIAALAKIASKENVLEMPLFMDTPLSRLSSGHRKNLMNEVPSFASQWILLATDTEFRKTEADLLKATGRWGRFYVLKAQGSGVTTIDAYNVGDASAFLKDVENFEKELLNEHVGGHQSQN